jgi:hypothetical protein
MCWNPTGLVQLIVREWNYALAAAQSQNGAIRATGYVELAAFGALGLSGAALTAGAGFEVLSFAGVGGWAVAQQAQVQFSNLAKPNVTDPRLQNIMNDLYKGAGAANQLGSGSTADAIRNELMTGSPTGGLFHITKGFQYVNALNNWLTRSPNAALSDIEGAEAALQDLIDALQTGLR